MSRQRRTYEQARQVPVHQCHSRGPQLAGSGSSHEPTVNHAGENRGQPGLLPRESELQMVLGGRAGQWHDRGQRTPGCVSRMLVPKRRISARWLGLVSMRANFSTAILPREQRRNA